jgi:hypothetical protein
MPLSFGLSARAKLAGKAVTCRLPPLDPAPCSDRKARSSIPYTGAMRELRSDPRRGLPKLGRTLDQEYPAARGGLPDFQRGLVLL